jgi:hypothetical protein
VGWLENLKSKVGDVKVSVSGAKVAPTRKPHAAVLAAIDHSIEFHKDPKYVLPSGRSKGKAPTLIYEIIGAEAFVHLPYKKTWLKVGRVGDQLTFDASKLGAGLQQLRDDVAAGAFDDKIAKLDAKRSDGASAAANTPLLTAKKTRTRKSKPTTK